jgi:hypothetical protein
VDHSGHLPALQKMVRLTPSEPATQPTPYPEVNAVVQALLADVQDILGPHFVGLYLGGSLAGGGFDPLSSDVDFLVVTDEEVPHEKLPVLTAMHARLADGGQRLAVQLEGSYIPMGALRCHNPPHTVHPHVSIGGSLRVEQHDSDWVIQRYVLREHGIAVAGPPIDTLIDPISAEELRQAVRELMHSWWAPILDDPARLGQPSYRAYAVLTMCRVLYTLQHATIVPKSAAAHWAQQTLDPRWTELIERALAWPHGQQKDDRSETLDLIRYALGRAVLQE